MDYRSYDTRLAAYAVVVDDRGQILLALWNEGPEPRWTMPGGGVELEETPQQATVRELREETGDDVRLGPLLTVHTEMERARPDGSARPHKSVRVVFEAEVVGGELTAEVGGTTDEARWFPLAQVPDLRRSPIVDVAVTAWLEGRPAGR